MAARKSALPSSSSAKHVHRCRLFVHVWSASDLAAQSAYCKMYVSDVAMLDGRRTSKPRHDDDELHPDDSATIGDRVFHTKPQGRGTGASANEIRWDETFEVPILDASSEILTVRVKSKRMLYSPVLGACCVHLRQLRMGHRVELSYTLHKKDDTKGRLFLHLLLSPVEPNNRPERGVIASDVKIALAANHDADEAVQRLLASGRGRAALGEDPLLPASSHSP